MNWTHHRPLRNQLIYGRGMNKMSMNRPLTFREHFHVPKQISDKQPIDAIRLQLADDDYNNNRSHHPCPVHRREDYNSHRNHPYIRTFSDHNSSLRRTHSSIHSISTIETDFVHQRVSTIHTYPSSPSIVERQQIIDQDNSNEPILIENIQINNNENDVNQPTNVHIVEEQQQNSNQSNQCRTCLMLIEIVDQQTQQIRQYTEQISQQADLLAKLARRFAGIEEGIDDQNSDNTTEQQTINQQITN
ncbi:unnamed protein product [Rotaria sp. Silwood1]|nr:unnamed protein product [Rotaria sp. Silwood1]CAF3549712.1 unnamed protein product [Rotaria sp. Silwood1]CAF3570929.1 unnamed protein product [Rotaria sp. Silwood1]CAF4630437.1 unnamed protein product [Rotaria sp. Silwood1]CAF4933067.1 unnamed protein product [Rotaria sp. Silwood1]